MKVMSLLAGLLFYSLGCTYDLESNREQFLNLLKTHDIFLKVSETVDSLNWYGSLFVDDSIVMGESSKFQKS